MTVRKFRPENRLAKTLEDPNGLLFGHAIGRAEANIERVRSTYMPALETKLDTLPIQAAASREAGETAKLYTLVREIFSDAGVLRLADLSRAAHSLCELLASGRSGEPLWAGVCVHVDALSALRRLPPGAPGREALLTGLEKISRTPTR